MSLQELTWQDSLWGECLGCFRLSRRGRQKHTTAFFTINTSISEGVSPALLFCFQNSCKGEPQNVSNDAELGESLSLFFYPSIWIKNKVIQIQFLPSKVSHTTFWGNLATTILAVSCSHDRPVSLIWIVKCKFPLCLHRKTSCLFWIGLLFFVHEEKKNGKCDETLFIVYCPNYSQHPKLMVHMFELHNWSHVFPPS